MIKTDRCSYIQLLKINEHIFLSIKKSVTLFEKLEGTINYWALYNIFVHTKSEPSFK